MLAGVDGEQEDKRHLQPAAKAIGDLGQPEPSRRPQDCEGQTVRGNEQVHERSLADCLLGPQRIMVKCGEQEKVRDSGGGKGDRSPAAY